MTCVAGHQPNLYPYAGFFAKAAKADMFVIADNTQYVRKEYHNRNRIRLIDGSSAWLTVPVRTTGRRFQKINEAEIDNSSNWRKKHEQALKFNYRKSPYLKRYLPEIVALLEENNKMLADFNIAIIRLCMKFLNITTPVYRASELGVAGHSTEYILDICRKTGSDTYLHGRHAEDYVDFTILENAGIKSRIQTYSPAPYPQPPHETFMENLSVLDILFNCGEDSCRIILAGHNEYTRN